MPSRIRFVTSLAGVYYSGSRAREVALDWLSRKGVLYSAKKPSWRELTLALRKTGGEYILLREKRSVSYARSKYKRVVEVWGWARPRTWANRLSTRAILRSAEVVPAPRTQTASPAGQPRIANPPATAPSRITATQWNSPQAPTSAPAPRLIPFQEPEPDDFFWHDEGP